jgi:transcriptional regulator with XRE-family HTH domain
MTGEELKAFRKGKGLNQADLAGALKVSRKTVVNWENGVFAVPADIMDRLTLTGIVAAPVKASAKLVKDTIDAYRKMRRNPGRFGTHVYIIGMWRDKGFEPCREAQQLILAEFPDILETPNTGE